MSRVWVGVARGIGFDALVARYIDPFSAPIEQYYPDADEDDEIAGQLVAEFGAERIGPGGFEVYAREHYPDEAFDAALFERLAPFPERPANLAAALGPDVTAMFFVINDAMPTRRADGTVTITDRLDVTFPWE